MVTNYNAYSDTYTLKLTRAEASVITGLFGRMTNRNVGYDVSSYRMYRQLEELLGFDQAQEASNVIRERIRNGLYETDIQHPY